MDTVGQVNIGQKLCETLGLDPRLVVSIKIEASRTVCEVEVRFMPDTDQLEDVTSLLKHYRLVSSE